MEGHCHLPQVALAVGEEAAHSILPGYAWAAVEAEEGRPRCLRPSEEAVVEAEARQTRQRQWMLRRHDEIWVLAEEVAPFACLLEREAELSWLWELRVVPAWT